MPGTAAALQRHDFSREEILASLELALQSKTLAHSASLRQALEFVVRASLASPAQPIKEYSLATEVFGRTNDFDPKIDNIVRVQMHRLREKLEELYLQDGRDEQVRITIPRGQYSPEYVRHAPAVQPELPEAPPSLSPGLVSRRTWPFWIAIILLGAMNVFLAARFFGKGAEKRVAALSAPLRSVWEPFVSAANKPLVIFANPAFLVDKEGDLYRYNSPDILSMPMGTRVPSLSGRRAMGRHGPDAGPFYYFDSYTGSGELVAASVVARFLTLEGGGFLIERSHIASYAEIKSHNVIFLGGVKEDRILKRLPLSQQLTFEPPPSDQYPMGSYIKDANPPAGYPASYHLQLDPATGAIQVEYGLISVLPNVSAGRYVLDFGGITTLGTQAAAEFATSTRDMARLEEMRLSADVRKPHSPFFQALLKVEVRDGVPLNTQCLLVRELKQ